MTTPIEGPCSAHIFSIGSIGAKIRHLPYLYFMQEKIYTRVTDRFLISHLAGETVLMDKQTGDYFGINKVGTAIWELLAAPSTGTTIVRQLLDRYEVEEDTCKAEVQQFLAMLEAKKMLLIEG